LNDQLNGKSSMLRLQLLSSTALALFAFTASAQAQDAAPTSAQSSGPVNLPAVTVTAPAPIQQPPISPEIDKFALPQTRESIDQKKIEATTNIVDTEDALKYLPSVFVRKRNYGDTQPTIQTRTWGVNSSARSLVYVDDVLISALISNNNTTGAPRWGMVSPEQIKGVDVLYGPFAAAYPGNSMGGVVLITTRMPEKFEVTAKQTEAFQNFNMYKTNNTYTTSESAATIGGKLGKFSFFLSGNLLDSWSQPLFFVTNSTAPANTTGTISALSKTGTPANVVGAGGLLHSVMTNVNLKIALDVTDWLRATYSIGYWDNNTNSSVQTYLTNASGNQTFGGVSGFASNTYNLYQQHLMNAVYLNRHLVQLPAGPPENPRRSPRQHQFHDQWPDRPYGWDGLGDAGSQGHMASNRSGRCARSQLRFASRSVFPEQPHLQHAQLAGLLEHREQHHVHRRRGQNRNLRRVDTGSVEVRAWICSDARRAAGEMASVRRL
jgi:outer membrane receptor protein involved in Fe transport